MKITSLLSIAACTALLSLAFAGPARAASLVANPNFDTDLGGWTWPEGSPRWSSFDARGLGSSGAAVVPVPANVGHPASLSQCLPVTQPGQFHTLSADTWTEWPAEPDDAIYIALIFFSDSGCGQVLTGSAFQGAQGEREQWHRQFVTSVAPLGARSMLIQLSVLQVSSFQWEGAFDNVTLDVGPCVPNETRLCLSDGRFQVDALWRKPNGEAGIAHVRKLTDETGYLWFFNPDNVEVIIKVKNACAPPFERYWVFASGLTNVQVTLYLTDTETGAQWDRVTPLGQPFSPILDTDAFATCPTLGEPPTGP